MTDTIDWQKLASALRELHRVLMERARRDYEQQSQVVLTPGELLQRLATDPFFSWLRGLSELMVDIDLVREAEPEAPAELASAVRTAVEQFVRVPNPPESGGEFARHYWPYLQDDPNVAIAHADVRRALDSWPRSAETDAAKLMHERHLLAEKARHRIRRG